MDLCFKPLFISNPSLWLPFVFFFFYFRIVFSDGYNGLSFFNVMIYFTSYAGRLILGY
jgi:hypothetical protein